MFSEKAEEDVLKMETELTTPADPAAAPPAPDGKMALQDGSFAR